MEEAPPLLKGEVAGCQRTLGLEKRDGWYLRWRFDFELDDELEEVVGVVGEGDGEPDREEDAELSEMLARAWVKCAERGDETEAAVE